MNFPWISLNEVFPRIAPSNRNCDDGQNTAVDDVGVGEECWARSCGSVGFLLAHRFVVARSEPASRIPRGLLGVFSRVATPRLGVERGRQASSPPILTVGMWSFFSGACASWRIISGGEKKDEAICKSWSFGFQISHVSPPPTDLLQQHQPGDIIFANPDRPGRIHALHKVQGGPRCHNPSQDHVLIPHPPTLPSSLGCLSAGLGRCRVPADSGSLCRVPFCNTAWLERTGQMTPKTTFM